MIFPGFWPKFIDGEFNPRFLGLAITNVLLISFYYFNYHFLIPRFYFSKKYLMYSIIVVGSLLFAVSILQLNMNLSAAQQLMREGPSYVTDIYVNIKDPSIVEGYKNSFAKLSGYKVEDWKEANETLVAAAKMRTVMMRVISTAILLVAAFGIYNVLNMTIMQKLNDIAILKATGFSGSDVIKIFVSEAFIMGFFGTCLGLGLASILVNLLSHVYIGGDIGYFPISFEPTIFAIGAFVGLFVTIGAGFIPARNATKVDPVEIFRK